jgi:hypothetical protein
MARMIKYAGNTLLQIGKFKTKEGLKYIIKRTTMIPTSDKFFFHDEAIYEIPCDKWRSMQPQNPGHDHWWIRLHDLYQASTDRAY